MRLCASGPATAVESDVLAPANPPCHPPRADRKNDADKRALPLAAPCPRVSASPSGQNTLLSPNPVAGAPARALAATVELAGWAALQQHEARGRGRRIA